MSNVRNEGTSLSFGQKLKRFVIGGTIVIGIVYGIFATGQVTASNKVQVVEKIVEVNMLPAQIEKLKDEVVAELEKCESAGYAAEAGILIFDSNNKASIGPLQMQKDHVKHFSKTLYGKEVTGKEAVILAIDPETARPFAKDVLFRVKDGWKEWFNCGKKLDLETKITYIKKMEVVK